jgi:aryl-alcohol dehydrogenase-like predicted oxidoreductase
MVDAWGGWSLFQELLSRIKQIADKYTVSIANVAVRYILEQPTVAGAIVGARLGVAEHLADNALVFNFTLDRDDREQIEAVVGRSQDLYQAIGDCGDEYRH